MTLSSVEKARQAAARAAAQLAEAERRRAEAEAEAAQRRQQREREWAEQQAGAFDQRLAELHQARTTTRQAFRAAVLERHEPGIAELLAVRKVEVDLLNLHRRLTQALTYLGQQTWHGRAIPSFSARDATYAKLIDEAVDQATGDYAAEVEDRRDREIRAVWGADAPEAT